MRERRTPRRASSRGEELGAGGFVQAAHASPEVYFPGGVQCRLERTGRGAAALGVGAATGGIFSAVTVDIVTGLREKLGMRLRGQGAGLLDAGGGNANVIIIGQGQMDQVGESGVVENLPPGKVRQGIGGGGIGTVIELLGNVGGGAAIVGADGAAGQEKKRKHQDCGLRIADCGLHCRKGTKRPQRGPPQPKELNHGFPGFHGFRILHPCRPQNEIGTEANEGNEEEFLLRFLCFLLFKRNPCHP